MQSTLPVRGPVSNLPISDKLDLLEDLRWTKKNGNKFFVDFFNETCAFGKLSKLHPFLFPLGSTCEIFAWIKVTVNSTNIISANISTATQENPPLDSVKNEDH